jgi:predicted transcriptional regulator
VKNRSKIEIIVLILQTAINGATRTKLLCKVCLSYKQLKEYLIILNENDMLLEYHDKEQTFITTGKGQYFLQTYAELNELVTVTNRRHVTAMFHYAVLTRASVVEDYAIYSFHYLVSMVQKMLVDKVE